MPQLTDETFPIGAMANMGKVRESEEFSSGKVAYLRTEWQTVVGRRYAMILTEDGRLEPFAIRKDGVSLLHEIARTLDPRVNRSVEEASALIASSSGICVLEDSTSSQIMHRHIRFFTPETFAEFRRQRKVTFVWASKPSTGKAE